MTRYNLILRDKTYLKIMQYAADKGKSFGKLANEILDEWSWKEGKDTIPMCAICGNKPSFNLKVNGIYNYLCQTHGELFLHAGYQLGMIE